MNTQFNYTPHTPGDIKTVGITGVLNALAQYVNHQMKLLSRSLRGAVTFDAGDSGTTKTITLQIADITKLALTDNVALTLSLAETRMGMSGAIEFTQDITGGRVVTFTNLVGTVPTITATANKRTLILFTHVGDGWVATSLAADY